MPRTRYYRKRPGYRAYIEALWQRLYPFMHDDVRSTVSRLDAPDYVAGLRSDGLSNDQIDMVTALLSELGQLISHGLSRQGQPGLTPHAAPSFFAMGAEMPASRFHPRSRLFLHLKPKGRPRTPAKTPRRPDQNLVDQWMLVRAEYAFSMGQPALKEGATVKECMAAINASRSQARVAFTHLPRELRRQRGQHDRWVTVPARQPQ